MNNKINKMIKMKMNKMKMINNKNKHKMLN